MVLVAPDGWPLWAGARANVAHCPATVARVRDVILPTGRPLAGEQVRLDLLRDADVEEL